jgi:hypothetical protein
MADARRAKIDVRHRRSPHLGAEQTQQLVAEYKKSRKHEEE